MSRFYVHLEQSGRGCDYTIGCGQKFIAIPGARTVDEAYQWVLDEYGDSFESSGDEHAIAKATVYESSGPIPVDLASYAARKKAEKAAREAQQRENTERAEFERLKAKFGG